jgi:hypothetical protein
MVGGTTPAAVGAELAYETAWDQSAEWTFAGQTSATMGGELPALDMRLDLFNISSRASDA